jgi:hypothetical protein
MQKSTRTAITEDQRLQDLGFQENEQMGSKELPRERVLNSAFDERGRDRVVMIEVLPIEDGERLKLAFESAKSPWRQGVWMKTDEHLVVNQLRCAGVEIWQDTAPREVLIECHTRNGRLHLYNIWDKGRGRESQSWSSGMLVEELPKGRRYRCNDIGFDTGFDKLVFSLERV